ARDDVGALVDADRQSACDVTQRDVGDRRVENLHEGRDRDHERDEIRIMAAGRGTFRRPGRARVRRDIRHRTLVQGTTDIPGPTGTSDGQLSTTILTGTRCTTFTKLPVAFSAGSRLKTVPEPGCTDSTWPF